MIFATDLDRTMIYSKKFVSEENKDNITLVEEVDGKYFSYMSNTALKKLEELNKILYVIPVTTRSIEQFKRINSFKYCKYAVTSNGGTILKDGKILEEWEKHIVKILTNYKSKFKGVMNFLNNQNYITKESKLIDNKFIFTKTDDVQKCEEMLDIYIDKSLWNFTIQGQKVYIIPKEITKSNAIKFLKKILGIKKVVAAGDGKLDKDLLDFAEIALLPKHGELYSKYKYKKDKLIIVNNGIFSSDEIIKNIYKIYKGGKEYAI